MAQIVAAAGAGAVATVVGAEGAAATVLVPCSAGDSTGPGPAPLSLPVEGLQRGSSLPSKLLANLGWSKLFQLDEAALANRGL